MPIYATNNGNIGDYNTVSGVVSQVSGSYIDLSGDYVTTSGAIADYSITSGDYSASSGDLSDYKVVSGVAAAGGGAGTTHITGLTGGAWSVFYSEESSGLITGLTLGASGLVLSSMGATSAPVWSLKVAGGGDDLGSHEATQMLDMNTLKITGLGDPAENQDAATKIYVDVSGGGTQPTDYYNTGISYHSGEIYHTGISYHTGEVYHTGVSYHSGQVYTQAQVDTGIDTDISTHTDIPTAHHNPTGYESISGDYLVTSGTISDYPTLSGDYSTHQGDTNAHINNITDITTRNHNDLQNIGSTDHHNPSGYETVSGAYIIHVVDSTAHHNPTGYESISGEYLVTSGAISDYGTLSGDYSTHQGNTNAHISNLTDITTRNHNDLQNIGVNDHISNLTGITTRLHNDLGSIGTTDHHDPSGYETISGAYISHAASSTSHHNPTGYETISGDYLVTSGDYSASSGDVSDYKVVSGVVAAGGGDGGGHNEITGLSGGVWSVFYSEADAVITGLALGADDTFLKSNGASSAPTFESYTEDAALTDLSNVSTSSEAQGDILLRGGSDWANLAKGTSGYALKVGASTALWEQIVEADIGDLGSYLENVNEDGSPELGGDLDLAGNSISVAPSYGSDHLYEGLTVAITTDAGAFGEALYLKSNGAYAQAKADAAGTLPCSAIYVASNLVLLYGTIRDDSYDFTIGGYVYVSEATAGLFTTTAPSTSTNLVQKVGIALSADSMYFNPGGFRTVTVA